jgi:hypothetical protein
MGGKAHSFDMGYGSVSRVDGGLDRLFVESWEGTQRCGILMPRQDCNELSADADNRAAADDLDPGDDVSAEDPADGV